MEGEITPGPVFWILYSIAFPFFLLGLFWFILKVNSMSGGWSRLAEIHKTDRPFPADHRMMQSAVFRQSTLLPSRYNGVLTFGASREGFWMKMLFGAKASHQTIFIPFEELSGIEKRLLLGRTFVLTSRRDPGVKMQVTGKVGDWLEEKSEGQWQYQRS